jgi:hypothetical protein
MKSKLLESGLKSLLKSLLKSKTGNCRFFGLFISLMFSVQAHAYFSTLDTGDTLGESKYAVSLEPQFILNRYDGANLVGRFDAGVNEESNLRVIVGGGKVDYETGVFYKYIPFPDTSNQPAIGIEAGGVYAHVQGSSELSLRIHPLISKHVLIDDVKVNIFGSIPFGVTFRDSNTNYPIQLAAGAEWKIPKNEQFSVMGEIGFNVNAAFSYVSFAGVYYFDEATIRH